MSPVDKKRRRFNRPNWQFINW